MSVKFASSQETICETLRKINDLHQNDSESDKETRILIAKAIDMAKRMQAKLKSYKENLCDTGFFEKNPDYEEDLKRRRSPDYKGEN